MSHRASCCLPQAGVGWRMRTVRILFLSAPQSSLVDCCSWLPEDSFLALPKAPDKNGLFLHLLLTFNPPEPADAAGSALQGLTEASFQTAGGGKPWDGDERLTQCLCKSLPKLHSGIGVDTGTAAGFTAWHWRLPPTPADAALEICAATF